MLLALGLDLIGAILDLHQLTTTRSDIGGKLVGIMLDVVELLPCFSALAIQQSDFLSHSSQALSVLFLANRELLKFNLARSDGFLEDLLAWGCGSDFVCNSRFSVGDACPFVNP